MVAGLNERKWAVTWRPVFPVQQADSEQSAKRLAVSMALATLPLDHATPPSVLPLHASNQYVPGRV